MSIKEYHCPASTRPKKPNQGAQIKIKQLHLNFNAEYLWIGLLLSRCWHYLVSLWWGSVAETSPSLRGCCYCQTFPRVFKGANNWCHFVFLERITPAFPVFLHPISWSSLPHFCDKRAFRTGLKWEVEHRACFLELLINILHCYVGSVLSMSLTTIMSASQGWWIKENPTLPRGIPLLH